jgi:nitroreductase
MRHNISEITEIIKDRRTIHPENFSDRKVHKEQIELLLNNAIWAPSHGLTQPWRFKVFMEEGKQTLADFLVETYKEVTNEETFQEVKLERMKIRPKKSSAIIAVCMERQASEKIPEIEEIEACACAVQNMHLTATAMGLGGFWASPKFIYSKKMNDFLGLGEKDKCLGLFYIGYPDGEWPRSRRKPIEYITEWKTD